jgi:hypothetical protein
MSSSFFEVQAQEGPCLDCQSVLDGVLTTGDLVRGTTPEPSQ